MRSVRGGCHAGEEQEAAVGGDMRGKLIIHGGIHRRVQPDRLRKFASHLAGDVDIVDQFAAGSEVEVAAERGRDGPVHLERVDAIRQGLRIHPRDPVALSHPDEFATLHRCIQGGFAGHEEEGFSIRAEGWITNYF